MMMMGHIFSSSTIAWRIDFDVGTSPDGWSCTLFTYEHSKSNAWHLELEIVLNSFILRKWCIFILSFYLITNLFLDFFCIWTYFSKILNLYDSLRSFLCHFEIFWTLLDNFEPIWKIFNLYGSYWTYLNHLEPFCMILNQFGSYLDRFKNWKLKKKSDPNIVSFEFLSQNLFFIFCSNYREFRVNLCNDMNFS